MTASRRLKSRVASGQDALCVAQKKFDSFRIGLEKSYGLSLPVFEIKSLTHAKSFCVGLLNPRFSGHPWSRSVSHLKLRDRLSIAGSLFLFRKVLPAESPCIDDFFKRMSSPAPDPPSGYLSFCSSELKRMFPHGWDRGWKSKVLGAVLSPSSCLEKSRKRGGNLGFLLPGESWFDRTEFCANLLDKYSPWRPNVERVKVVRAAMDGKERLVTINSVDMSSLIPYHQLVYDHISKEDWCLRGEAKTSAFKTFTSVTGEVFVSGDYESATDNLNQEVARHILGVINRSCTRVPLFVRDAADRSLTCVATCEGREAKFLRGQLMGNALSFPLLCLQNYLAFKFVIRRDVPVRINGDDIVFRATMGEYERWSESVTKCGLKLSLGKTIVSKNFFSLNSTFFTCGIVHVRLAPVVRSAAVFKTATDLLSLEGKLKTLKGFSPDRKRQWTVAILKQHSALIWWGQRSLNRALGLGIDKQTLIQSGLYDREVFYQSLPEKGDPPLRQTEVGYFKRRIPDGWVKTRVGRRDPELEKEFFRELISNAWNPVLAQEKEESVDRGPFPADLKDRYSKFRSRLAGFKNVRLFSSWLRRGDQPVKLFLSSKPSFWVRKVESSPITSD